MVATVFTANPALNADDVNNRTSFRVVCTLAAASNGSLQVTIQPGSTNDLTISNASIGKWSGSGANTTATPLELKFGGASGFTAATTAKLSDLLDHTVATNGANGFSLASGDKVVVIYDIVNQGTAHASQRFNGSATNADTFYKVPGTSWNSNSSTGFTQLTGYNYAVAKVETNSGGTAYTLTASGGSYAITGTAATLRRTRNLVASAGSYAITGQTAALKYGKKLAATGGSYGITGAAASVVHAFKIAALAGSYSISGTSAALTRTHLPLSASAGSYSITGSAASLKRGYVLGAASGSYSISGTTATLRRSRLLGAASGSYAISGSAATLTKLTAYKLAASAGSYAISGSTASVVRKWVLAASSGSYGITGSSATLTKVGLGVTLSAGAGSYSVTGTAATLKLGRKLAAVGGSYSISGQAAGVLRGRRVSAASGSYAISGTAAALKFGRKLQAASGSYAITGSNAALNYSGVVAYVLVADTASYLISGTPADVVYTPRVPFTNPLGKLKMYTGSLGSVSNREDWIVSINLIGDDGTQFDLTGAEIVTYVCKPGCPNSPLLSGSIDDGVITLSDNYTMQWFFDDATMKNLCPAQYDVFCRVTLDDITTQLLAANIAVVDGGPQ